MADSGCGKGANFNSILRIFREGAIGQSISQRSDVNGRLSNEGIGDEGVLYIDIIGAGGYGVVHRVLTPRIPGCLWVVN